MAYVRTSQVIVPELDEHGFERQFDALRNQEIKWFLQSPEYLLTLA